LAGAVNETLGGWFAGGEPTRKTLFEVSLTAVFLTHLMRTFAVVVAHEDETETADSPSDSVDERNPIEYEVPPSRER
jgi:hypothetical protein